MTPDRQIDEQNGEFVSPRAGLSQNETAELEAILSKTIEDTTDAEFTRFLCLNGRAHK